MRVFTSSVLLLAYAGISTSFVYTWPDPKYDGMEGIRWQQLGYNQNQITTLIEPCDQFLNGPGFGRSNAADWVRTVRLANPAAIYTSRY